MFLQAQSRCVNLWPPCLPLAASAQSGFAGAETKVPSLEAIAVISAMPTLDSEEALRGDHVAHAADSEPASRSMLNVDDEMAGLLSSADMGSVQESVHVAPPAVLPSPASSAVAWSQDKADTDEVRPQDSNQTGHRTRQQDVMRDAQPVRVTADVDSVLTELTGHVSEAQSQQAAVVAAPSRLTSDIDQTLEDLASSALEAFTESHASASSSFPVRSHGHVTADIDDTLVDLSASAVSHAAALEAAEAAVIADIALDSMHEAAGGKAVEGGDSVLAQEAVPHLPARPASPVAKQLKAATAALEAALDSANDKSAPASLAGDRGNADAPQAEDAYEDDVFEPATDAQTDARSEDGLVVAAGHAAQEEEVCSDAGCEASSDLDVIIAANAEAEDTKQAASQYADESYENDAFDMEAEPSELTAEPSAARQDLGAQTSIEQTHTSELLTPEPSVADNSAADAHSSADCDSAARAPEPEGVSAEVAAPQPPPQRPPTDAQRPGRPSRAFIRHAISMTQPDGEDSSRAGPLNTSPLPSVPHVPAGAPPRHRWVPNVSPSSTLL